MNAYTAEHIGAMVNLSAKTIRRRISSGELRATNVGTPGRPKLRVTEAALKAWLDARELKIPRRQGRAA